MLDVLKIRQDFGILSREVYGKPLIYLDSGATAQKPQCVMDKTTQLYSQLNANIHRGAHYLSDRTTAEYEAARETVRRFIHAASTREIVFTSGATLSINTIAYSYGEKFVREGDEVIVSEMEHHSNIVPWQLLCQRKKATIRVLPFSDDGSLRIDLLPELLNERTRIVAVTQASNVLGTRPDLESVIRTAHAAGVPVLVDGCQGIVHGGVDVQALDCDFYAFSGHKLYGPTGIGVLYAKEKWLEELPPFLGGGDMVGTVSFEKTTWADLPFKYEAGTANFIGAIGLAEAIRYVENLDPRAIGEHEHRLLEHATCRLSAIEALQIFGRTPEKCSILSFNIDRVHHLDIGAMLDKTGVAVRTGTHCAEPLMTHYGVTGMVRASLAMYNTLEEIDIFADNLTKIAAMLRS
ncbi:MAG: SufS family cysteine desulfurase [Rikenellaceae bacterium]|nr:SufS family cysteine desulfurase [Rikenellaceae bacterium]